MQEQSRRARFRAGRTSPRVAIAKRELERMQEKLQQGAKDGISFPDPNAPVPYPGPEDRTRPMGAGYDVVDHEIRRAFSEYETALEALTKRSADSDASG